MRDSSSEDQERSRKRWIWELIQNAVDCCRFDDTIDIVVDFDGSSTLIFSHNGRGFDKENLWSIVLQTSNKSTDTESRGGFISTTLISPRITIDSFLESTKERVLLNLDRSGESVEDLRQSIDENVQVIEALDISLAVLLSEACNIGFSPVSKEVFTSLKYDRLVYVNHHYVRIDTLSSANQKIIKAHKKLKASKI